jgi:predicted small secreted protein
MKAAVGIASMLPFGIGKGVKVAAPVVKKAAEMSEPALAKIVETVMSAGKLISVTGKRVKDMVTKKKLKNVEVEEDIADGSYIIKKDGKEIYYKPGRMDETGGIDDSIIEVIEDTVTKKAGGGIARMLGE